jgi:hypothetical protein
LHAGARRKRRKLLSLLDPPPHCTMHRLRKGCILMQIVQPIDELQLINEYRSPWS